MTTTIARVYDASIVNQDRNSRRAPQQYATEKQIAFARRLVTERKFGADDTTDPQQKLATLNDRIRSGGFSKREMSQFIDWLLRQPKVGQPEQQKLEPGVYETPDGIFVVKPNRAKTNLYAKRLVEIAAERATESGERAQIEFEYAPGAIRNIRPEHKMDLERAKELTVRYGHCINCGRHLKAAESVERGIGPVCRKAFRI